MIGSFPAASNITGLLNDDLTITALLHQYGALSFWDYATAAPHTYIDVNPKITGDVDGLCKKDAVYFSCHKFIGGVQTPGILIAKKKLFSNPQPDGGGGGSVFFVTNEDHRYLKETELREEGGTPAIVESIRAGLAMQLKQSVGIEYIARRESKLMNLAKQTLSTVPNFCLIGNGFAQGNHKNLPILSFLIEAPSQSQTGKCYLHHNFVSALLNDVFGIQSRGGCACAGPYAQSLIGMPTELAKKYESVLLEDDRLDRAHLRRGHSEYSQFEVLRPGFTRVNFSWFSSDNEVNFVLDALKFIAEHGWKLMPQYIFNNETGEWRHHTNQVFRERRWLGNISYAKGKFSYENRIYENTLIKSDELNINSYFKEVLEDAKRLALEATKVAQKLQVPDQRILFQDQAAKLRWMVLPIEAKEALVSKSTTQNFDLVCAPFSPLKFLEIDKKIDATDQPNDLKIGSLLSKSNLEVDQEYLKRLYSSVEGSAKKHKSRLYENKNINIRQHINGMLPNDKKENTPSNDSQTISNKALCEEGSCILPEGSRSISEKIDPLLPKSKCRWHAPTKDIFKPFIEAVEEFRMIRDGDRVLVCLSGGKDSLSLLHTLRQYQFYAAKQSSNPIKFEIGALTVDPQSSAYDPRPLIPYLAELGVPYLYEEQAIMKQGWCNSHSYYMWLNNF
jgi:selenocysteine lyase/cysteine desulfurase